MNADGTASRTASVVSLPGLLLEDQNWHLSGHHLPGSGHHLASAARRAGARGLVLLIGDSSFLLKEQ